MLVGEVAHAGEDGRMVGECARTSGELNEGVGYGVMRLRLPHAGARYYSIGEERGQRQMCRRDRDRCGATLLQVGNSAIRLALR